MTPIRPTTRDLSLKFTNSSYAYKWFPLGGAVAHTASQTEKDMMEWTLFARTIECLRYLAPFIPSVYRNAFGSNGLLPVTTRLGIGSGYEGAVTERQAIWEVGPQGRHYSNERSILKDIRAAVYKKPGPRQAFAARPDLRDLLDLNPTLDGPAEFTLAPIPTKYDTKRAAAFPVTSKKRMPLLTQGQLALLEATHAAHHIVSDWRRDPVNKPAPPQNIVGMAHDMFEASARNEEELHFFAMKPFSGFEHPAWTRIEIGQWATIQDHFHHEWKDAIRIGDWGRARRLDTQHLWAHIFMNIGPAMGLKLLWATPDTEKHIDDGPDLTAYESLELFKELGVL